MYYLRTREHWPFSRLAVEFGVTPGRAAAIVKTEQRHRARLLGEMVQTPRRNGGNWRQECLGVDADGERIERAPVRSVTYSFSDGDALSIVGSVTVVSDAAIVDEMPRHFLTH
jgi:hypothetical protein